MTYRAHEHIKVYHGPNIYCPFAAVQLIFPASTCEYAPVALAQKLSAFDLEPGFEGTDILTMPQAVIAVAVALQPGHDTRSMTGDDGVNSWVCLAFEHSDVTRAGLSLAYSLVASLDDSASMPLPVAVAEQLALAAKHQPHYANIAHEMSFRNVPIYKLASHPPLWQLGQGKAGRHSYGSASDADTLTGVAIAKNKIASRELIEQLGYPVTRQHVVATADSAVWAAGKLGYPCVIKPIDGGMGLGVTVGVSTDHEARYAFTEAKRYTHGPVVVENMVAGDDHRLAVFGGRLCWVVRRRPAMVVGDGVQTVKQLVAQENAARDPKLLEVGHYKLIKVDAPMAHLVAKQGFELDSVIPDGRQIFLRSQANIAQGGVVDDLSDHIHPDNLVMAEQIAKAVRLNACGMDFITDDISRSWHEGGCAWIEINETPSVPGPGNVYLRFKAGQELRGDARIPSFLLVGDCREVTKFIAQLDQGKRVIGVATETETRVGEHQLDHKRLATPAGRALALVLQPSVDALVIQCTPEQIIELGLPLDFFDLAVYIDAGAGLVDARLEALLDHNCAEVVHCRAIDSPAVLTSVAHTLLRRQRSPYQSVFLDPVTPAQGASLVVTMMKLPCLLRASLERVCPAFMQPFFSAQDAALFTGNQVPLLCIWLARNLLAEVGQPGPDLLKVTELAVQPSGQSRQRKFQVVFADPLSLAQRKAIHWSLATINQLLDSVLSGSNWIPDMLQGKQAASRELAQLCSQEC